MKMIPTDVNYWVSSWWWTTLASIWLPSIPASILLHSTLSARGSRTAFSPASAAGSRGRQWCTCCPWMRSNPASNGSQMASITDWTTAIHVPVINIVHHNSHSMQPSQGRMLILPDTGQKSVIKERKTSTLQIVFPLQQYGWYGYAFQIHVLLKELPSGISLMIIKHSLQLEKHPN